MEEYDRKGVVIMSAIDKLIQIANAEVGYLEKSSNSQLDSKTARQQMPVLPTTQNIGEILNPNTKDNRGARVL